MKKLTLTIISLFSFLFVFGQYKKENLPQYFIQKGDTIGVLLTVEQLQKLDNDTDLLELYKDFSIKCDSLDKFYIKVVNNLNEVVTIQEVKIKNLQSQNDIKDDMILNLKETVIQTENKVLIYEEIKNNNDDIISGLKKDLRKSKIKNVFGFSTTGILTIITIVLGVSMITR